MASTLVNEIGRNVQAFLTTREQNKPAIAAKIEGLSASLNDEERTIFMSAASQQLTQLLRQAGMPCIPHWLLLGVMFILVVVLAAIGLLWSSFLPPLAAILLVITENRRRLRYVRDVALLYHIFDAGRVHRGPLLQLQDAATGIIRTGLVHAVEIILAMTGVALLVAGGFHALDTIAIETRNMAPVMAWTGFVLILVSTMLNYTIKLRAATTP